MKRPLIWAALLLTLGVLIINSRPESRDKWLLSKPSVRMGLERSSSGYFPISLKGTVLWAEEKNGRMVYKVDCGRKTGTVLVYEQEDPKVSLQDRLGLVGSSCRISGTAFLFQPADNPGQFDVQAYYDDLGIYFGVSQAEVWTDEAPRFSFRRRLCSTAASFRELIRDYAGKEDADFLLMLTAGDSSESEEQFRKEASALAAFQLISLSGFILSSIGILLYRLLRKISANLFFCASLPVLAIVFYYLFLGSPASMIRALILFVLRVTAPIAKRRFDMVSAAALSVIMLAIMRPTYLLLPAMSFYLAVLVSQGVICPSVQRIYMKRHVISSALLSFFSMQACLLPVQILSRHSWSPYGMILVYFLLPLKTAAVILTLTGGALGMLFGGHARWIVQVFLFLPEKLRFLYGLVLSAFGKMPLSSVNAGRPENYKLVIYGFFIVLIPCILSVLNDGEKHRNKTDKRFVRKTKYLFPVYYALLLVFGMCFLRAPRLRPGEFRYTMLSVGQGDSGIIRTDTLTVGVDAGSSSREDAGGLFTGASSFYGIRKMDVMILTHEDLDHVNGLPDILADPGLPIGEVWIPDLVDADELFRDELQMLAEARVPVKRMGAGDRLASGNTVLEVLSPVHGSDWNGNEGSLVVKISAGSCSILFTGDISEETERRIIFPESSTDILKVAHHGSRFSSGEAFIRKVSPDLALVSYGKNHTYGHPADETVIRFREARIPLYGTGRSGAIETTLSDDQIILRFYGKGRQAKQPL